MGSMLTYMGSFELARRAPSLRGRLLWWLGRRDCGRWRPLGDWRSGKRGRGGPLLLLHLLRDGLVSLRVQVQDLVADVYKTKDALTDLLMYVVLFLRYKMYSVGEVGLTSGTFEELHRDVLDELLPPAA